MYNEDKINQLDRFVSDLAFHYGQVENFTQYLNLDETDSKVVETGLKIIKKKIKKMTKSRSVEELKEVVKVKKVLKERSD